MLTRFRFLDTAITDHSHHSWASFAPLLHVDSESPCERPHCTRLSLTKLLVQAMLSSFPVSITFLFALLATVHGFLPAHKVSPMASSLHMLPQAPPPSLESYSVTQNYNPVSSATSPMQQGVENYLSRSSSMQVALQERKAPTKEEIEAKKRNFNLIFWGTF